MTPVEKLLESVAWEPLDNNGAETDLPHATHSGVLEINGLKLRCYTLNDGRRIFDAEDINALLDGRDPDFESPHDAGQDLNSNDNKEATK
ncbi:MAG: hypothetical protein CTY33_00180 [Methylotenera sp.]|nr:MAG: hypothetical protein CTY33_00180 [Methylotenera sp.]